MAERKKSGYGESPLTVLSLIVSMASVIVGGIAWAISYHASLVTEEEMNNALAGKQAIVEAQLTGLEDRFENLRLDLRLTVIKDVLRSKEMELDMYQKMAKDDKTGTLHRSRIIELGNELATLRKEQDLLIEESNDAKRHKPTMDKNTK